MRFIEHSLKITGRLTINKRLGDNLLWTHSQENQITSNGLYCIASMIANQPNYNLTKLGFGDSSTMVSSGDTHLNGDWFKIADFIDDDKTTTESFNKALIYWHLDYNTDISGQMLNRGGGGTEEWPVGEAFTIREFALYSASNTMFNHIAWTGPDLVMDTDISLDGNFQITIAL